LQQKLTGKARLPVVAISDPPMGKMVNLTLAVETVKHKPTNGVAQNLTNMVADSSSQNLKVPFPIIGTRRPTDGILHLHIREAIPLWHLPLTLLP